MLSSGSILGKFARSAGVFDAVVHSVSLLSEHTIPVARVRTLLLILAALLACAWAQPTPQAPEQPQRPRTTAAAIDRANAYTKEVEDRIWRVPAHVQPVAWARLFALWYKSGYRSELRRLRHDVAWHRTPLWQSSLR